MDVSDPARLAPEVLLYDKLVIPVPATDKDRKRWEDEGWRPGDQEEYIKMLGSLALQKKWGDRDQALWAEEYAKLKEDATDIVNEAKSHAYGLTRRVLAQQEYPLPLGVEGIDVVTACQSENDFLTKFGLADASNSSADLGLKLGQKIAVPFLEYEPKSALERSVTLALDPTFCQKRTTVYDLQCQILSNPKLPLEKMQELEQRTEELISYVTRMTKKVRHGFTFGLVGVQPGYAAGRPLTYASRSTTLSTMRFRSLNPVFTHRPGVTAPTIMYHE
jgi:hypothetical protein